MDSIKLSPSENKTLTGRGYQLLSKIGEGAYAQVKNVIAQCSASKRLKLFYAQHY